MASVPLSAARTPPETGASRKNAPCAATRSARLRAAETEMVLMSAQISPGRAPRQTPSSPSRISSTSGPAVTQVRKMSASAAAAAGENGPGLDKVTRFFRRTRPDAYLVSFLQQIADAGTAHSAQTDESHTLHGLFLSECQCIRPGSQVLRGGKAIMSARHR